MKKFGFATIVATGFAAALVGLAVPAQATVVASPIGVSSTEISSDLSHHTWVNDIQPKVQAPPAPIVGNGR